MAGRLRNIGVSITGSGADLKAALLASAAQIDAFAGKAEGSNARVARSWQLVGAAAAGAGVLVAGAMGAAGVAAAQFETRMRNVNSITRASESRLAAMSSSVLDLSRQLPQSANVLAEGLYEISSSGFAGAEGLTVLKASAEAASAGLTSTDTSARAITAVLNAYGREAGDATDVSDVLFSTVDKGVISFEALAQNLGDVVGAGAAAGVSVDQLGSALATITRAGVPAAEAATSLNRLLTELIVPSEALATTYAGLGYESGLAALQAKGLHGVMEDLRVATGGSADEMFRLFPEVRAARGAMALLSDEGKTYAEVAAAIESQTARAGATQKALAEQSKATAYQLAQMANEAKAAGIEFGLTLLPTVLSVAEGLRDAAEAGGPYLAQAFAIAQPVLRDLAEAGVAVWETLGAIIETAAPVGAALAGLAAGGVSVLANALTWLVETIGDSQTIIIALEAVLLTRLLAPLVAATIAAGQAALSFLAAQAALVKLGYGANLAATAGLRLLATLGPLAAVAAPIAALTHGMNELDDAERRAGDRIGGITDGVDAIDTGKAQAALRALRGEMEDSVQVAEDARVGFAGSNTGDIMTKLKFGFEVVNPFGANPIAQAAKDGQAATDAYQALDKQLTDTTANVTILADRYGISTDAVKELATQNDIDLRKPWREVQGEVDKFGDVIAGMEQRAGVPIDAVADSMSGISEATLSAKQAVLELMDAAGKAAGQAFAASSDIISGLATDAEGNIESLGTYYERTLEQSQTFSDGIREAIGRGLDPAFVQRLLTAGPAAAAPVLEQLVGDSSGAMIDLVNQSEAELRNISEATIAFARITAKAVAEDTDRITTQVPLAMDIAAQKIALGADATFQAIADALGVSLPAVLAAAEAFGITVGEGVGRAVQAGIDNARPRIEVSAGFKVPGGTILRAGGGMVYGAGTGTSDSILMRASTGEHVTRARAVAYYGPRTFDALNRMQIDPALLQRAIRGYAAGGLVQSTPHASAVSAYPAQSPTIVRVPVHETHTTSEGSLNFWGDIRAVDVEDFRRQARGKRLAGSRGWQR